MRCSGKHADRVFPPLSAVVDGDLVGLAGFVSLPPRNAGVGAVFAQNVVNHVHELQALAVAVVVADDAF